jgi:hypothetical protein
MIALPNPMAAVSYSGASTEKWAFGPECGDGTHLRTRPAA